MEINLSALWRSVATPFAWFTTKSARVWHRLAGKRAGFVFAKSRRNRANSLSPEQSRLKTMRLLRLLAIGFLVAVVLAIIGFFVLFAYFARQLPEPGGVMRDAGFSSKIYDRNGELLYDLFQDERRNQITYEQIGEDLRNATIAVEDKDFYRHKGFDILTILRIPYNLVVRRRVIGGSTLTQQLVKNALLSNERTLGRKFKELVLAMQIERKYSKEEILTMYLNEAPYGGTAWGVGTAAEIYFNKKPNELNLVESAFLAGLPQRPSAYSPYSGKKDADGEPLWKMRTRGVLNRMREDGYITRVIHEDALSALEDLTFERRALEIKAPHFVFYVRDQLVEMFGEEVVDRGGLKVTTTLDLPLHNKAQAIVNDEITKLEESKYDYHISNGASITMNPKTGEILSMVGSRDYFNNEKDGQFNVAVDGLRQPGSSIKPITYLAMLQRGYTPATMLVDARTNFAINDAIKRYEPVNYDGKYRGPVSLRDSLGSSLNVPAVKSLAIVGVDSFLNLAYQMGLRTLEPTEANLKRFGYAVTLGGAEVYMLDLISAYSSFANGGIKTEPVSILKIEDQTGKVLYEHRNITGARIFSQEEAFLINHILSDNSARLIAFGANSLLNTGRPIAVKTGTTNDRRDNWTIGWSQEVIVVSWVGNNDNSSMKGVASGITGASPIWRNTIFSALELGYKAPDWQMPEGIEEVEVNAISGYPSHDDFPSKREYVIKGTLPPSPDPIHRKVKLCRGENKLANEARISSGDYDEREFIFLFEQDPVSEDGKNRWQEGINAWIDAQDDSRYKVPTEYCGDEDDISVRLIRPENEKKYNEEDIEIEVRAGSGVGVEKIELWINGNLRETVNHFEYKGKIRLSAGQHEIYAKAKSREGKWAESNRAKIGTGGQDWRKPEPTAVPQPTSTPMPTVTPIISPTSVPSPTPTVEAG